MSLQEQAYAESNIIFNEAYNAYDESEKALKRGDISEYNAKKELYLVLLFKAAVVKNRIVDSCRSAN